MLCFLQRKIFNPDPMVDRSLRLIRMLDSVFSKQPPEVVKTAKSCAIPRWFDVSLISVLADEQISTEQAENMLKTISNWDFVQHLGNGRFAYRREIREHLRSELQSSSYSWFLLLNQRAHSYFNKQLPSGYEISEMSWSQLRGEYRSILREKVYHLLQIDIEAGFSIFQALFRGAHDLFLAGEASALLKIIQNLDMVILNEEQRSRVTYFEAWQESVDGNFEAAESKLSDLLKKSLSLELRSQILILLGKIYESTRNFSKAIEVFLEAQKISLALQLFRQNATLTNNLGVVYWKQGDRSNAEKQFQQALVEFKKTGNVMGESKAYNNLGAIRLEQGERKDAFYYFEKSIALKLQIGDQFGAAITRQNVGIQYQDLSKKDHNKKSSKLSWDKALKNYLESLDVFKLMGALSNQAMVLYRLALLHDEINDDGKARSFLEEALSLFKTLQMKKELSDSVGLVKKLGLQN